MKINLDKLGIDTLPLAPNSKSPVAGMYDWQNRPPEELWVHAKPDSNIGVRCGGDINLVVLDCDDKNIAGTSDNICQLFEVEGYPYDELLIVQTASGIGRHFYGIMNESPKQNIYLIDESIGSGEIRCGIGSYVVAPPSRVENGSSYQFINGDFANIPILDLDFVIGKIAKKKAAETSVVFRESRRRLERPKLTPRAQRLLTKPFKKGEYKTRSEAEFALIISLINRGFSYEEIKQHFIKSKFPGKFARRYHRNKITALRNLEKEYKRALNRARNHESEGRIRGRNAYFWAVNRPWEGRTGSSDRTVFIALANIAFRSGKIKFGASSREVGELSGVNKNTASKALKRLFDAGFIKCSKLTIPYIYWFTSLVVQSNTFFLLPPPVGECMKLENHDSFRWGALNKSGYEIYFNLSQKPMTVNELVEVTGRCKRTIEIKLKKMNRTINPLTREVFSMVEKVDNVWHLCDDIDLNEIAKILGSFSALAWQKLQHQKDRESYIFRPSRRRN